MIRRLLAGTAAVAALAVALSGCQARPASAAFVGDHRISIDTVDDYVGQAQDDPASKQLAERFPGQTRLLVVQALLRVEVLKAVARQKHLRVTEAEVDQAARDVRAQRPALSPEDLVLPVELYGEEQAYIRAVIEFVKPSGASDEEKAAELTPEELSDITGLVVAAVKAEPVTVNPRYGKFDAAQFRLVTSEGAAVVTLPSEQEQS